MSERLTIAEKKRTGWLRQERAASPRLPECGLPKSGERGQVAQIAATKSHRAARIARVFG